jgi:hypothetical protein
MRLLLALAALLLALPAAAQPVRPGSALLDTSPVVTSTATYTVRLVQPIQQDAGVYTESIRIDEAAGTITSVSTLSVPMAGQTQTDSSVAAWPSLAPISHQSTNPQRLLALAFDEAGVAGMSAPTSGAPDMIDVALDAPVFDASWTPQLLQSLPLAPGYTAQLAVFDADRNAVSETAVTVTAPTEAPAEDAPIETWTVQTQGSMTMTYTFDGATRAMQRMRFSPQPGVTIELVRR